MGSSSNKESKFEFQMSGLIPPCKYYNINKKSSTRSIPIIEIGKNEKLFKSNNYNGFQKK